MFYSYLSASLYSQLYFLLFHVPPLQYLGLLLCVFLLEIIAGVLAYITYQEVTELKLLFECVGLDSGFLQTLFP